MKLNQWQIDRLSEGATLMLKSAWFLSDWTMNLTAFQSGGKCPSGKQFRKICQKFKNKEISELTERHEFWTVGAILHSCVTTAQITGSLLDSRGQQLFTEFRENVEKHFDQKFG